MHIRNCWWRERSILWGNRRQKCFDILFLPLNYYILVLINEIWVCGDPFLDTNYSHARGVDVRANSLGNATRGRDHCDSRWETISIYHKRSMPSADHCYKLNALFTQSCRWRPFIELAKLFMVFNLLFMHTNKTHFALVTFNCYFIPNGELKLSRMAVTINNDWNSKNDFVIRFAVWKKRKKDYV